MSKFDDREKSFEKKFQIDEEREFKISARSNKYLDEDQQLEAKRILRTRIMDQQQNSGTGLTGFDSAS